jgi:site-specific DNA-methyltransferase (adenine-specific)/adenine-specific DNA-methyltransferase
MPTLNWIGKQAVVNHHREVPFHLLKDVPELSCGDPGSGNLIVEGDNLIALKALLPYYAKQVKCIYIDPPYNTGNEGWVYNDNVNSPVIRKWLGKVVGREGESLDRHDRWLCMMYPRLMLLHQFLRDDGAIFISIDDNEVQALRYMMDEIFGEQNFVATIIWQKMDSPKNTAYHLSEDHDYIVVYAKRAAVWRPYKLERTEAMLSRYKNPDNDPRGPWLLSDLAARNFYAQGRYSITTRKGRVIDGPPAGSYWRLSKERFQELEQDNRIWWGKSGDNRPGIKRFLSEVQQGVVPQTLWFWKDVGSTRNAKQELSQLMAAGASQDLFITPKPTRLIQRIVEISTGANDLVLDSFAGSGATAHAVLQTNEILKSNRRFIIIEIESEIARNITAERVRRAAHGYLNTKSDKVEGLGGGFRYCHLGEPLFDQNGTIPKSVRFTDLARHVFFTETGEPLPNNRAKKSPLLGITSNGVAVYLVYNGILEDRSVNGGNILTSKTLALLPRHDGLKVVYAAGSRLSNQRLKRENITFKQTPYAIKVK